MKTIKRICLLWMIMFSAAVIHVGNAEILKNPTLVVVGFLVTTILYFLVDDFKDGK